jgi:hypothetical protein
MKLDVFKFSGLKREGNVKMLDRPWPIFYCMLALRKRALTTSRFTHRKKGLILEVAKKSIF